MTNHTKSLRYLPFLALCAVLGCAEGETPKNCEENTYNCDNNILMYCQGGNWQTQQYCNTDQTCNAEQHRCAPNAQNTCQEGAYQCDRNRLMLCQGNSWNEQIDCSARQGTCNAQTHDCDKQTVIVCNDGQKACINNAVMECQNNEYKKLIEDCGAQKTCNSSSFTCEEQILIKCGEGDVKCVGTTPMICSDNDWVAQTPCGNNETCNSQTGACDIISCTPGAATCEGNTLKYCDNNAQNQTKVCPAGTNCSVEAVDCIDPDAGKCTVDNKKIDNGASVCSGGSLVTCNNGNPSADSCGVGKTCRDGENACSDYKSCTSGSTTVAHEAQACGNNGKAVVRCEDGELNTVTLCSGDTVCMSSDKGYSCEEPPEQYCTFNDRTISQGAYVCDGNVLRFCNGNALSEGVDCKDNNNGKSQCLVDKCVAASCTLGTETLASSLTACNAEGTQIVKCTDGVLSELTGTGSCTSSQICQMQSSTPSCVDKGKDYTRIGDIWQDYNSIVDASCSGTASMVKPAKVEITGVVTHVNKSGDYYFFIQDPSVSTAQRAGIMISCANNGCKLSDVRSLSVGQQVKVIADGVGYSYCQLQVRANSTNGISIAQSGSGNISAIGVDTVHINSRPDNLYNSSLVSVSKVMVTNPVSGGFMAQDSTGVFTISTEAYAATLKNSSYYAVTGIVKYTNNTSVLMPRSASDIKEIECTGTATRCEANKLYTCTGTSWDSGKTCTTTVENATAICDGSACGFECKDGYYPKDGKCEKIETAKDPCSDAVSHNSVQHGSVGCSAASVKGTCDDGNWIETIPCSGPADSIASCNGGVCGWDCKDGFDKVGDLCVAKSCTDMAGNTIASGNPGCGNTGSASGKLAQCMNGQWVNPQVCERGCDPSTNSCKSRIETAVGWCRFQWLGADRIAFSRVRTKELDENGVQFTPYFRCTISPNNTVSSWSDIASTTQNTEFSDPVNKEYMTAPDGLPSAPNSYACVALVDIKDGYTYICPNDPNNPDLPTLRVDDTTIPNDWQFKTYVVESPTAKPVTWCKFYIDESSRTSYVQFLPPVGLTANDVTATTYCTTDLTKYIASWETTVPTANVNSSCGSCGTTNTEYMTNAGALPGTNGAHYCVGVVTVTGGNSYVCPTDPSKLPVLYTPATMADENGTPTQWGYTVN